MEKKTITEYLSNEYKDFAMYTIENRALPSVIDGFKISQRKIIHVSNQIWKTGSEKTLKVFQLGGKVASDSYYHHSNSSLEGAIVNMAQKFKNSLPLLEEEGQFGSLRSPQAGASRYIGTKLSKNFRLIYKDFELLDYKEEEGESIEPNYFLPIIPTILLNGSLGVAVGFKSNILNRNAKDLVDSCLKILNGKKITEIKPEVVGFNGTFTKDTDLNKRWIIKGIFKRVNTTTINITELPPSMTYENYEKHLDKLVDKKIIVSYDDNCKDNIDYVIKFNRESLQKYTDEDLDKILKLTEYETEIFSSLDENGKLIIFDNVIDLINYFVNFRLKYYTLRKEFLLSKMERELKLISNRLKFIEFILKGDIIINNQAKSKIIEQIEKKKLDKLDDSYDYLLRMPIYSLTKELFLKLKEDHIEKKNSIKLLKEKDTKSMYIDDLNELKKSIK